ncbi:OsmC family peroxiredoxin [Paenibacillaceae bacterium]|nr:OsmC family peroxiredoxin [Paenibacillaceae bacterium]
MIKVTLDDGTFRVWNGREEEWASEAAAGWSPLEMMEGALALCVAKSLQAIMKRDDLEAEEMEVLLQSRKAEAGASRVEHFQVEVSLPSYLNSEYQEKLLKHASMICTIGNTYKRGSEISYNII